MLNEPELRRPGFVAGDPIVLADGQAWHFPRPQLEILPVFDAEGNVTGLGNRLAFGPDYDAKVERFQESVGNDELTSLMALAADLLRRNYTLAPADLAGLLIYRTGDEACVLRWKAIADCARGIAPKPSPVGDASS